MRLKHPLPFGAVLQPSQLWGRYSSRRVHVHPRNGRFQSGNQIRQRPLPLPLSGTNGSVAPLPHSEKLSVEAHAAFIGTAVCRVPPLEIPPPHGRRQAMSALSGLRS